MTYDPAGLDCLSLRHLGSTECRIIFADRGNQHGRGRKTISRHNEQANTQCMSQQKACDGIERTERQNPSSKRQGG